MKRDIHQVFDSKFNLYILFGKHLAGYNFALPSAEIVCAISPKRGQLKTLIHEITAP